MLKDGKFFATIGSPGGATITTVLQTFLNMTLFDMNVRGAVDEPRFHHQYLPDIVEYEREGLSADTVSALGAMGYKLRPVGSTGDCNAIMRMPDGSLQGWSDHRNSLFKADGY